MLFNAQNFDKSVCLSSWLPKDAVSLTSKEAYWFNTVPNGSVLCCTCELRRSKERKLRLSSLTLQMLSLILGFVLAHRKYMSAPHSELPPCSPRRIRNASTAPLSGGVTTRRLRSCTFQQQQDSKLQHEMMYHRKDNVNGHMRSTQSNVIRSGPEK